MKTEKWIYPPAFFMEHLIPDRGNGFKSTATVLKKNDSSPSRVRKSGPTAERVWMLPDDAVLKSVRGVKEEPELVEEISEEEFNFDEEF